MRALVGGHLCIDFFPQMDRQPGLVEGALYTLGPMVARPGGCVYTTGQTMAGLGVDVRLAAAVGQDPLAGLLLELCRSEGLDTAGLSRIDASTSYTIVSQAPGRDRTFWHHLGANEFFDGRDLDLTGVDLVHIGYPNLMAQLYVDDGARLVDLFARAHELGCTTSVDLAVIDVHEPDRVARWTRFFDQILPHTDVISPSLEDLASVLDWPSEATPAAMAGAAQRLLTWGVGVVLITGGVHGLHVATADEARLSRTGALAPLLSGHGHTTYLQPALPVAHVAGTTGAGDVATAGFLSGLLSGVGPAGAAEWAARAAARHVSGDAYSTDRPEPFKDPEPSKDEETAR